MPEITYNSLIGDLRSAIAEKRPWSFLRFGDGEGIILGYPQITKPFELAKRLDKWFGAHTMTEQVKRQFAEDMRESAKKADVIGIPGTRHKNCDKFWYRVVPLLQGCGAINNKSKHICMDVVIEMQERGEWRRILTGLPFLGLITCRLLSVQAREAFGIPEVQSFLLPPQNRPCVGPNLSPGPHYPDRYKALPFWLDVWCKPGAVFLVGAGGLGKLYCNWIKERGGVAIDIGSILDGWAGYTTRSYLRGRNFEI